MRKKVKMIKNRKVNFDKFVRKGIVLALILVLTLGISTPFMEENVWAENGVSLKEESGSVTLKVDTKTIKYGNFFTNVMTTNVGDYAYCSQPSLLTPNPGTYAITQYTKSSVDINNKSETNKSYWLWKASYYGFGGYGSTEKANPTTASSWFKNTDDETAYVLTHILISYMQDSFSDSTDAFVGAPPSYITRVKQMAQDLKTLPDPPDRFKAFSISISGYQNVIGSFEYTPQGYVKIIKTSSNIDISNKNDNYSLKGAVYGVYKNSNCSDNSLVTKLTTDSNGQVTSGAIEIGTYYIKEITPPSGYALNDMVYTVNIEDGKTLTVEQSDSPQNDVINILINKLDKETGINKAQGGASLKDAEYTVKFYNVDTDLVDSVADITDAIKPTKTWVLKSDENGIIKLSDEYLVEGDSFYKNFNGEICLPLGVITVTETKAPEGYNLDTQIYMKKITSTGTKETVECIGDNETYKEQVKRGDLEFIKVKDGDLKRLKNIPFLLTNTDTGEAHVIVTDKNGEVKTTASWNKHTKDTNANDKALNDDGTIDESKLDDGAGIYFNGYNDEGSGALADDNFGALPYGTYRLDELSCTNNQGLKLIEGVEIKVYRDTATINLGTITDDVIEIGTTATNDSNNKHYASAQKNIKLTDVVKYKGLTPGREYTVKGTLMDKETGKALEINGEKIEGETTFICNSEEGSQDVNFTFDGSSLKNMDIVVFEKIIDARTDTVVAVHEDLTAKGQTIAIKEVTKKDKGIFNPQTSDPLKALPYIVLSLVALGIILSCLWAARKKKNEENK